MKFLTLAFAVGLALAAPAYSQPAPVVTLQELIARKSVPLSLQAKDLNETYAHFQAGGENASDASSALLRAQMGVANAFSNRVYYTKGDTLQLESGTYLVTYAAEERSNASARYNEDGELNPVAFQPAKLRSKDKLLLSLLDLRAIGNLSDFQTFDAESDMESEADRHRAVVSTLKMLGRALHQRTYEEDDQRLPRWTGVASPELEQWTAPYAPGTQWKHPSTDESFGLNPALSGRTLYEIANSQWVYLAYERTPAADGSRAVLFADFHVERVNAERWERVFKGKSQPAEKPTVSMLQQGTNADQKLVLLESDALLYYLYKKQQDKIAAGQTSIQYYLSKNGRVYYRDSKTKQAIWISPPKEPIYIPVAEASDYENLRGYNGSMTGLDLTAVIPNN